MEVLKRITLLMILGISSLNTNAQSFSKSYVYDELTLTGQNNQTILFDYDGDGDDDVFCFGSTSDNRVLVFHNNNGIFDSSFVFYNSIYGVKSIAAIDFDLDGNLDLIANDGGLFIKFENIGNGDFDQSSLGSFSPTPSPSRYITSGDIDNDGISDLIYSSNSNLMWIKGTGGGNFETSPNTLTTVDGSIGSFKLADLENDGDLDIIVKYAETTNTSSSAMCINDGVGNFTTTNTFPAPTGKFGGGYTLSDFNNDGWIDLVYVDRTFTAEKVIIRWNDQNNSFNSETILKDYTSSSGRKAVTVGKYDFNGDNDLDLLVGENIGNSGAEGIVLTNNGNQSFTQHSDSIKGARLGGELFFSDFDADGNMDVLTNSNADRDLIVHYQDNDSKFSTSTYLNHYFAGIENFQILDYDGDGNNDLVTVDEKNWGKLELAYGTGSNEFDSSEVIVDNRTAWGAVGSQLVFWNNNSDYDLLYSSSNKVYLHLDFNTPNDTTILLFTSNPNTGANTGTIGYTNINHKIFTVDDVDNDGDNDLIIPQRSSSGTKTYHWIENTGGGTFIEHTISAIGFQSYLIADVDNDGDLDFIGQRYNSSTSLTDYHFFEMDHTNKVYTDYLTLSTSNVGSHQFAAGDIDSDGDEDIVISGLRWMENDGAGNFTAPTNLVTGYETMTSIVIEDIDDDGLLDIVTNVRRINPSRQLIVPLFNQGGNVFQPLTQELEVAITNKHAIGVGDFNNNGFKSIVVGDFENSLWTPVLFNFCVNAENTVEVDVCSGGSYTLADGTELTNISQNDAYVSVLSGQAANGCDSIVTENINVLSASSGTDILTACNSYMWIDGNTYTSNNNTATHTLTNAAGCDSVVTLDLTINNSTSGTDQVTACDSYTWIDGNTYTSSNTTATHTLTNAAGCDSVVTLDLTINQPTTGTDVVVTCNDYTWIDGNTYTTSNNTATYTLTSAAGCDSVVTLDLTIDSFVTGTDVISACETYTWIDGNTYTSDNNTATQTLTSSEGCDSIVTLDLTINSVDNGVTITNDTELNADQTGADYQWLDCDNNFAPISGETNQQFEVLSTGNYAVEVTINNCSDTSDCIEIDNLKIGDQSPLSEITVYPNPTDGKVNVDLGALQDVTIELSTIEGKVLSREEATQSSHMIDIKAPKGLFIIKVSYGGNAKHFKVVKM